LHHALKKITYPGTATSQFIYDAFGRTVKIVESTGSTKQFIWCDHTMCEARDGTGTLLNQYFDYGQTISGSHYLYSNDHLGSVREVTDSSGNIQAQYSYDSYGRVTQLEGSLASAFQFAGFYSHTPSGLDLSLRRAYDARPGRWLSRDPSEEVGGVNLFSYVLNNPICFIDPSGLEQTKPPGVPHPDNPGQPVGDPAPNTPYYQRPPYNSTPCTKYKQRRGLDGQGPQIQEFDWGKRPPPVGPNEKLAILE
jgi:RHS repeat-associated protein